MGLGLVQGTKPDLVEGALLEPPPLSCPEPHRIAITQKPAGAAEQGWQSVSAEPPISRGSDPLSAAAVCQVLPQLLHLSGLGLG